MHAYTILLIGAWVLGSGLVAYVCDNLGRKLGKKRLSLWGMRPRHTAMVFTVLTGVGIAAVTVGLVALAVPDARVALFQVQRISRQVEELSHTQKSLEERNRNLQARNRAIRRENVALENAALHWESRARESERKAGQARLVLHRAEGQRDRALRGYQSARTRLVGLKSSRDKLALQVSNRQARLSALTQRLSGMREQLTQAERAASQARSDQSKADREARRAKDQVAALQKEIIDETLQLQALSKELAQVSERLDQTQKDLNERRRELAAVSAGYVRSAIVFRNAPLVYSTGQEIARRVIYNPSDKGEVNLQIVKLLEAADEESRRHGANPPQAGYRAVQLAPYHYVDQSGKQGTLDESEQILRFSELIVKDKKDVVIQLVAGANSFEGETVQANLVVTPNELVFQRGEVIASDRIDGSKSEAEIIKTLINMLQTKVRAEALKQGLLPSPNGEVGDINWDQMLEAVKTIRSMKGMAEVEIVAFADAWTADPLAVRFVLQT